MKYLIHLLIISLFSSLSFSGHNQKKPKEKSAKVVLLLDDYISSEEQWVYLHGFKTWVSGNEFAIFDSAFIKKGQQRVELQAMIPQAHNMYLLFEKKGPIDFDIAIEPDSCVIMNIDEKDGDMIIYKRAIQGDHNNLFCDYREKRSEYMNSLNDLVAREQKDSIQYLQKNWTNWLIEQIETTPYPDYASLLRVATKNLGVNMHKRAADRFPEDINLQEGALKQKHAQPSMVAKEVSIKIAKLTEARMKVPVLNTSIGEKLNLSFFNTEGDKVSFADCTTDYLLVDFWASWCVPCRKEIPYIKQALEQHKDKLSVYAISIDSNHRAWQKAIETDSTQAFEHLIGTSRDGYRTNDLKKLDIKTIPVNYILDKNQNIVGKNIRGERLIQFIDSLVRQ